MLRWLPARRQQEKNSLLTLEKIGARGNRRAGDEMRLLCVVQQALAGGFTPADWMDRWLEKAKKKRVELALCFFTSGNWWFSTNWMTIKRASCQKTQIINQSTLINALFRDKPIWATVAGEAWSKLTLTTGLGLKDIDIYPQMEASHNFNLRVNKFQLLRQDS